MEQSESIASDSTKKLSAEEVLRLVLIKYIEAGKCSSKDRESAIIDAMEKYASQKDAQIQALTKEVDGLKGHIEHLESQIFTLESTEADQISQFKISGNKMAEALDKLRLYLISTEALEEWEKLNK